MPKKVLVVDDEKLIVKGMNPSVDRIFQMAGIYAIVEKQ